MSTTQDETTKDLQRVIAELRQERDAVVARKDVLAEVLVAQPRKMPESDGART